MGCLTHSRPFTASKCPGIALLSLLPVCQHSPGQTWGGLPLIFISDVVCCVSCWFCFACDSAEWHSARHERSPFARATVSRAGVGRRCSDNLSCPCPARVYRHGGAGVEGVERAGAH